MKTENTMILRKIALLMAVCVLTGMSLKAQDLRFSQPYASPLKLNPAIMGANTDLKLTLNYRSQWASIEKGYSAYNMNILLPFFVNNEKGKLDIGLGLQSGQQGAFNTLDAVLAIGYNMRLSETGHNISASILGGYVRHTLDADGLTYDDQYVAGSYDAANPTSEAIAAENVKYPEAGFGLMWYYNPSREVSKINAFFGVASYHVQKPNESFTNRDSRVPSYQSFQAGIKVLTDGKIDFSPQMRYINQGGAEEIAPGLYLDFHLNERMKAVLGGWYRRNSSTAVIVGLEHKVFTIGYSYDIGMSDLNSSVSGLQTHELSLSVKIDQASKKGLAFNPSPFSAF